MVTALAQVGNFESRDGHVLTATIGQLLKYRPKQILPLARIRLTAYSKRHKKITFVDELENTRRCEFQIAR
jgi:hypothetical protein